EACAGGVPVLVGPHTFNFADATEQAIVAGAARRVADAAEMIAAAAGLLADDSARSRASAAALAFSSMHGGATARTVAALLPLLAAA
ncbi:MAG: 3-deoxy-D-manno-octulosonic acid transferase, partial [Burkholderiaceae bacterium]|nr:3-deoxy-D-manno-octulosonic acid transferase [Burkholderiaceae bacterium]